MFHGITPTPNSGFVRKLKQLYPELEVEFSREHERFIITQPSRLRSGRVLLMIIGGYKIDNSFRQPDERDLKVLWKADMWRIGYKKQMMDGERAMLEAREKEEAKAEEEIRERTKDDKIQLSDGYRRAFNIAKANATFRRIENKPKPGSFIINDRRKLAQVQ
jgi:hypothetical protein